MKKQNKPLLMLPRVDDADDGDCRTVGISIAYHEIAQKIVSLTDAEHTMLERDVRVRTYIETVRDYTRCPNSRGRFCTFKNLRTLFGITDAEHAELVKRLKKNSAFRTKRLSFLLSMTTPRSVNLWNMFCADVPKLFFLRKPQKQRF